MSDTITQSVVKHDDIYLWASEKTGEQTYLPEFPYVSNEVTYLKELLKTRRGLLIIVRAYRGVGKTTTLQILASALERDKTTFIIWKTLKDYLNTLKEQGVAEDYFLETLIEIYEQLCRTRGRKFVHRLLTQRVDHEMAEAMSLLIKGWDDTFSKREDFEEVKEIQGRQYAIYKVLVDALSHRERMDLYFPLLSEKYDNVLIDFSDSTVRNQSSLSKRIDEMQTLWRAFIEIDYGEGKPNIIFTMQKELSGAHFLEGKATIIDLAPVPSKEIVKLFKKNFETSPFTDGALELLASKCEGNIRHFKEYVTQCLVQSGITGVEPITGEEVAKWTGVEEVVQRLSLQLTEVFPKSRELREIAIRVLDCVKSQKEISQVSIVDDFFIDGPQDAKAMNSARVSCSRLLNTLEKFNYIKHRKEGRNNIWSLVQR